MTTRKYRFKIVKVAGIKSKPDRIKRLIPLFENHRMILPASFHVTTVDHETKDMIHEFVENEYMAFPVPVHDDGLDSLSRICDTEGHVAHVDGRDEKVKLTLKWPDKKPAKMDVPTFPVKDRGIGY